MLEETRLDADEIQRLGATRSDQNFEAFVVSKIAENSSVVWIVFDDEQDWFLGLEILAIVVDLLRREFGHACRAEVERRGRRLQGLTVGDVHAS